MSNCNCFGLNDPNCRIRRAHDKSYSTPKPLEIPVPESHYIEIIQSQNLEIQNLRDSNIKFSEENYHLKQKLDQIRKTFDLIQGHII